MQMFGDTPLSCSTTAFIPPMADTHVYDLVQSMGVDLYPSVRDLSLYLQEWYVLMLCVCVSYFLD